MKPASHPFVQEHRPRSSWWHRCLERYTTAVRGSLRSYEYRYFALFRYLLFLITSVFYLITPPGGHFQIKLAVVAVLAAATFLASNLYKTWYWISFNGDINKYFCQQRLTDSSMRWLQGIVLAEIAGICLVLIPTGGFDSPFVWYALNPIITMAYFAPAFYGWGVLGIFLVSACSINQSLPGHDSLFAFASGHLSQFLVFLLTTSMVQVMASLHKSVVIAFDRAEKAHQASEKALQHISSLYQALEAFSTREDHKELADILAEYTARLTGKPAACLLQKPAPAELETVISLSGSPDNSQIDWPETMHSLWSRVGTGSDVLTWEKEPHGCIIARPIVSHGQCFGILAFLNQTGSYHENEDEMKTVQFLADLGGITLDRIMSDHLWGRLLVSEEQNRISSEMHDTILQDLFSITCTVYAIMQEKSSLDDRKVLEQLKSLHDTALRAARDMRATIYNLSPAKRNESIFVDNIAVYLDELGRLNGVKVDLQVQGSEDVLSPDLRRGLYRIVREACSNAVRHGHCSSLQVSLKMMPDHIHLLVQDNGCSFSSYKPGLGIRNMMQIAARFGGNLEVKGNPGQGTLVVCSIPGTNGSLSTDHERRQYYEIGGNR